LTSNIKIFDVAIVGGGLTGMFTAWSSVQHGLSTITLDKRLLPGSGSTMTSGGSIGLQDKISDITAELALESIETYKSLQLIDGESFGPFIDWCGGLVVYWSDEDRAGAHTVVQNLQRLGIQVDEWTWHELRRFAPPMSHALLGAFYCPSEGKIVPRDLAQAMQKWLLAKFSASFTWQPLSTVNNITSADGIYTLHTQTTSGPFEHHARSVVLATGAYHNEYIWPVPRTTQPRRGLILTFDALESLDFVMHGSTYVSSRDTPGDEPRIAFSFEQRRGNWRLGSSRELIGRSDVDIGPIIKSIRQEAERHIPGLKPEVLRRVDICFRPYDPQATPFVVAGPPPFEKVASINGQEGEGITLAPALGKSAIELLWPANRQTSRHSMNEHG
jgi:glycine/D-amino acid oxidase-like deaminating enzyme